MLPVKYRVTSNSQNYKLGINSCKSSLLQAWNLQQSNGMESCAFSSFLLSKLPHMLAVLPLPQKLRENHKNTVLTYLVGSVLSGPVWWWELAFSWINTSMSLPEVPAVHRFTLAEASPPSLSTHCFLLSPKAPGSTCKSFSAEAPLALLVARWTMSNMTPPMVHGKNSSILGHEKELSPK